MKNKIKAIPGMVLLALVLFILPLKADAAEKEYTVTYRPGKIGRFTEALLQKYEEQYGTEKVSVSQATGSVSITVSAGSYYPEAPQAGEIELDEAHEGRYYVTTGWIPTEEVVMQDDDYVVDYAALVDGVSYTIRYVDAQSGSDLATPVMSQANAGDMITATAKVIEGYSWDAYTGKMTLDKENENVITFKYTYNTNTRYETVYLPGETIYNVITLPGQVIPGSTTGGTGGQGTGGQGTAGGQGTVDDQEPSGGQEPADDQEPGGDQGTTDDQEPSGEVVEDGGEGSGGQGEDQEVIIDEEDVPLAAFEEESSAKTAFLIAGIVALGMLLMFTLYRLKRNKVSEE